MFTLVVCVCSDLQYVLESQSHELWSQMDPEVQFLHATDESVDQLHTARLRTHTHAHTYVTGLLGVYFVQHHYGRWGENDIPDWTWTRVSAACVLPWERWSFYACRTAAAGTSRSRALQPAQWCTPEHAHDWNTHTTQHQ